MLIFSPQTAYCAPEPFVTVATRVSYSWPGGKTADGHGKLKRKHKSRRTPSPDGTRDLGWHSEGSLSEFTSFMRGFDLLSYYPLQYADNLWKLCLLLFFSLRLLNFHVYQQRAALIRRLNKSVRISEPAELHNVLTTPAHTERTD